MDRLARKVKASSVGHGYRHTRVEKGESYDKLRSAAVNDGVPLKLLERRGPNDGDATEYPWAVMIGEQQYWVSGDDEPPLG